MDTIIRVGGSAGDGVASTGQILARAFSRLGYHVNAYNSYQSVIRGGHVWYNIRVSEEPVESIGDRIDVLLCIDHQTAEVHAPLVAEGGVVVHEASKVDLSDIKLPKGAADIGITALEAAKEIGSPLLANVVAVGAVAHAVGLDPESVRDVIQAQFGRKGEKMVEMNYQALDKGYEFASQVEPIRKHGRVGPQRALIPGNEGIALGAMAAGLTFYAAYPMTPASTILHYLAQVGPDNGVVVKQMEDEIGVVNATIGAAWAGARAMCGTSGGGLALMTEAIGFAGMAEVGLVIVNSMRGGPSTGLPTKTEQADLWQMLGAGQGDYPKALVAPQDPHDAYLAGIEATEIADRYQMPVFVASDFYLSETSMTLDKELPPVDAIDRGAVVEKKEGDFLRYKITDTGVSPRSIPGTPELMFIAASDEHDEDATLISDVLAGLPNSLKVRIDQVDKRARKLDTLLKELPAPEIEGETGPILISWGSTAPILREARRQMAKDGVETRQLTLRWILPFHTDAVREMLEGETFYVIEASSSGQLEDYIRMRTGLWATGNVRRYDGEPFTPGYITTHFAPLVQEVVA
ncbi:MAG: 2-oxoacid:acceptor oxidoreductase subunit alpha [Euryarchaeota archaeon]|nr:2-oxoacid:acceptor oxidoreductase subunit alpha [Euryarchaeota archaeon]